MLSTQKKLEISTRREVERKLVSLGLSHQDIATALDIDSGSVRNDLEKIGAVEVMFDMTNLTNAQRRDKAFNLALREWFEIHDSICNYSKKLGIAYEVVNGIETALSAYLDIKRLNGFAEGVATFINTMIYPVDPPEYVPYRQLLLAIFGYVRGKKKEKKPSSPLYYYFQDMINHGTEFTRDSFQDQLTAWASEEYRHNFNMPLNQSVKVAVDEALSTLPTELGQNVIRLRFGLSDGKILTHEEIGVQFAYTRERIRQIEAKSLRQLRHPTRARNLRLFLESPFDFTRRTFGEMFVPPPPPVPEMTYEEAQVKNTAELLSRSVEELELSVRCYNALKNLNIPTIGDLVVKSESEMLRTGQHMNFGHKSLNEIKELLGSMRLCFGMKIENGILKRPTGETVEVS